MLIKHTMRWHIETLRNLIAGNEEPFRIYPFLLPEIPPARKILPARRCRLGSYGSLHLLCIHIFKAMFGNHLIKHRLQLDEMRDIGKRILHLIIWNRTAKPIRGLVLLLCKFKLKPEKLSLLPLMMLSKSV